MRGTSYPGYGWKKINYPEGVAPSLRPEPRVPFVRRRAFEVHGEVGFFAFRSEVHGERLATFHVVGFPGFRGQVHGEVGVRE